MDLPKLPQLPILDLAQASLLIISQSLTSAGIRKTGVTIGTSASDNEVLLLPACLPCPRFFMSYRLLQSPPTNRERQPLGRIFRHS